VLNTSIRWIYISETNNLDDYITNLSILSFFCGGGGGKGGYMFMIVCSRKNVSKKVIIFRK
jgi:hypothetical protein